MVGVPKKVKTLIFSLPLHFGKTITGSFGDAIPKDIPRYLNLMLKEVVNRRAGDRKYALKDINLAISESEMVQQLEEY